MHFFSKKMQKYLRISKKSSTFAPAFEKRVIFNNSPCPLIGVPDATCKSCGGERRKRNNYTSYVVTKSLIAAFDEGAVVQLVRIPACHAVGREFESRPHRKKESKRAPFLLFHRFHVNGDVRALAEAVAQFAFDERGAFVRFVQ